MCDAKGERENCGCNSAFGAHLSLSWTDETTHLGSVWNGDAEGKEG